MLKSVVLTGFASFLVVVGRKARVWLLHPVRNWWRHFGTISEQKVMALTKNILRVHLVNGDVRAVKYQDEDDCIVSSRV